MAAFAGCWRAGGVPLEGQVRDIDDGESARIEQKPMHYAAICRCIPAVHRGSRRASDADHILSVPTSPLHLLCSCHCRAPDKALNSASAVATLRSGGQGQAVQACVPPQRALVRGLSQGLSPQSFPDKATAHTGRGQRRSDTSPGRPLPHWRTQPRSSRRACRMAQPSRWSLMRWTASIILSFSVCRAWHRWPADAPPPLPCLMFCRLHPIAGL